MGGQMIHKLKKNPKTTQNTHKKKNHIINYKEDGRGS
jgi:hypothetical protein